MRGSLLAVIVVTWSTVSSASAEPIVLESFAGPRPTDADRWLSEVRGELETLGFAPAEQARQRIHQHLSRSVGSDDVAAIDDATQNIERGYRLFVSGQLPEAVAELKKGLDGFAAVPAALIAAPERRDAALRGQLGLALALRRLGRQTEATAAMAELVRSFPDKEISYRDYGPEPRDFFENVRTDLGREGHGSLAITADDQRAVVFVNERYTGVGAITVRDLLPGRYRIMVQRGSELSRLHVVQVQPGETTAVTLSWPLDRALSTDGQPRLAFESEADRREHEAGYSIRIARAVSAQSVVVLGIRHNRGRRSVVGAVYSSESSRPLRSGAVAIDPVPPSRAKLRGLARFLAGDEDAAALVAPLGEAPLPGSLDPAPSNRPFATWKWITGGLGLAAIGAGATLIAVHEPERIEGGLRNPNARSTRTAGIITASAGLALTGIAVYMFVRDRRDRRRKTAAAALVPNDHGLHLVFTGRF